MRSVFLCLFCLMLTPLQAAEDKSPLESWVIPGAEAREQGATTYSVKEPDQADGVTRRTDTGQYLSEKPFQEVVAFYVKKSGFEPPNWSILGHEFPGTDLYLPAHWTQQREVDGKLQTVIIQHFIRKQAAVAQLLLTNQPAVGTISISITRGKADTKTLIQIVSIPASDQE